MIKIDISIIVPVYNTEKYLYDCIESVLSQDFENFELIFVNDGSVDNSLQILQKYAFEYPERIKLINQQNEGLSGARNNGMMISEGEYILFLDSDDMLKENSLTCLKTAIEVYSADVFAFNSEILIEYKNTLIPNKDFNHEDSNSYNTGLSYFDSFVKKRGVGPSAVCFYLFKRKLLIDNNLKFADGLLHEDELFIPQVLFFTQKTNVINKTMYIYRLHKSSISQSKTEKNFSDILLISEKLFNFFVEKNVNSEYIKKTIYNLILQGFYGLMDLNLEKKAVAKHNRMLLFKLAQTFSEYKIAIMINLRVFKLYCNFLKSINHN